MINLFKNINITKTLIKFLQNKLCFYKTNLQVTKVMIKIKQVYWMILILQKVVCFKIHLPDLKKTMKGKLFKVCQITMQFKIFIQII